MKYLKWNDLTKDEKIQATETYLTIREEEEQRNRCDVLGDYSQPIDWAAVTGCRFERKDGYVEVII